MDKKQHRKLNNRFRKADKEKKTVRQVSDSVRRQEGEIMTIAKSPVKTMAPTTPVYEAIKLMAKEGIRRMPIVDPGTKKLLGMVTLTDIINYLGGGEKFRIIEKKYGGNFYKAINEPIKYIMNADVISIRTTARISEAMEVMKRHNVGGLPITDEEQRIQAIVTEHDIVMLNIGKIRGTRVAELMTKNVITERPETPIIEIEKKMIEKRFRRLPILADGRVIGMATVRSWLKFFGTSRVFEHIQSGTILQILQTPVREIIIKDFPAIHPDADVREAADLMRETHRGSLLVIENDMLVGIITERDFFRLLDK